MLFSFFSFCDRAKTSSSLLDDSVFILRKHSTTSVCKDVVRGDFFLQILDYENATKNAAVGKDLFSLSQEGVE